MTRCPSCGSSKIQPASNRNEFSCGECDSVFNPVMEKIYVEGNYKTFCKNIASLITENMTDASVGSSIREIVEGFQNENPLDTNILIEKLVDIAQDLYNDYQMNRRSKYDFGALLEGINRLNEFANIQSPQDDTVAGIDPSIEMSNGEVPNVEELPDPMSMLSKTDGPIEVGEHSALEDLKCAISAVQAAITGLENVESQENSAGQINADPGITAIPTDDSIPSVVEGLQSGTLDAPVMGNMTDPTSIPSVGVVDPTVINPAGNEGPEHEADEQGAIAQLKDSLAQLQNAYAKYIGSETEVHGEQPSGDFTDKLNALTGLDSGIDSQTYLEKAKELMEDAQLVDKDWVKKDLDNSIDISTQEIAENALDSTIKGGIAVGKKIGQTVGGAVVGTVGGLVKGTVDGVMSNEEKEVKTEIQPTWKNTFNADNASFNNIDDAFAAAKQYGYIFMQLNGSLFDIETKEQHRDSLEEARVGENDIPTQTIRKPIVKESDPGIESGEIADQPGEVDVNGPIHTDDISQGFDPENFFKTEDNVLYENKQHVVIATDGRHLTIRNPRNGHTIEVLAEEVSYANSEDVDIRGERFNESNNSLLAAWEKIEKTINSENLNAIKRTYDLRTNIITEGF